MPSQTALLQLVLSHSVASHIKHDYYLRVNVRLLLGPSSPVNIQERTQLMTD